MSTAVASTTRRPGLTLLILAVAAVSYVLQQTLVVPALPTIERDLNTTNTWGTWVFTGFLLTSAIASPLLGKLGDMHGKKKLLMVAMAVFIVGTVAAALATSIAMLILARALQGAAGAIFPLAFGIIRDEFPPEKVGTGLGTLSATFGVGGGVGLVLSGVILQHLHWSWLFWIGAFPIAIALVLVWRIIPESPIRRPARLDWQGAILLSIGLAAFLVALSEGETWGWLSGATLGVFALSILAFAAWVVVELRIAEPLVDIALMRDRAVLWTNVAALIAGFAMFGTFLLVTTFVQMGAGLPAPMAAMIDYGFQASVVQAGLYLIPASAMIIIVGPLVGRIEPHVGARMLVMAGMIILGIGGLLLAVAHTQGWEIVVAMALVGTGVGLVYAMLAKLIIDAVEPGVTGIAMGMNTVMRTVGGVIGGQVGAAIISIYAIPGTNGLLPAERGFTTVFAIAGVTAIVGAFCCLLIPRSTPHHLVYRDGPGD
ncbi:MAG: MFS transporter [Gaiellales bacterium]